MINPSESSVIITCYINKENINEILFEINDGGKKIQKNFFIRTDSIEVIIDFLLKHGVSNNVMYPGRDRYFTKRLNNYDEKQKLV
jgi:hypothetical protein